MFSRTPFSFIALMTGAHAGVARPCVTPERSGAAARIAPARSCTFREMLTPERLRLACRNCRNLFAGTRDLSRELPHRVSLPGHFCENLRPAPLVKSRCRSELLEWNGLQRVDAVEQKDTDGRDIGRHLRDTIQKLEPEARRPYRTLMEAGGAIIRSRGVESEARPETLFVLNAGEGQAPLAAAPRARPACRAFRAPARSRVRSARRSYDHCPSR